MYFCLRHGDNPDKKSALKFIYFKEITLFICTIFEVIFLKVLLLAATFWQIFDQELQSKHELHHTKNFDHLFTVQS